MATTQVIPSAVSWQPPAVVVPFRVPTAEPIPERISQVQLEEFILLRRQSREAAEKFAAAEASIREQLDAGAEIEQGIRLATLKEAMRRNVAWKDVVIRLAERLKLDGEAYCANVLKHTKPTSTFSVVVE
jgi:hypothetical protein